MKPFRFTLEALSTLRRLEEQKAMDQYAQCLIGRRQAVEALESAERDLKASSQDLRGKLLTGCTAAAAEQGNVYQQFLVQRRGQCAVALETAERRVSAALEAMLHSRKQREIVDKFFDKQKASYVREQGRLEQKFMDDLAGRRRSSVLAWKSEANTL
jgi:flagellar export protein FliJ